MINPTVSICIPTYEQPENLRKCLESVSFQGFKDFEVIVTDDSKSDLLKDVVNEFSSTFKIKYYKNTLSLGAPKNWNEAIKHARGKYIKILHHDDFFSESTSLEKMVMLLDNNPQCSILFCSSMHVDSNYKYHSSHILDSNTMKKIRGNPNSLFLGNLIGAPSVMLYRSDINIYFDERMKWLVDLDFYIRALKLNDFVFTSEELMSINLGEVDRVTYQCENDKNINVFEHMLLLSKINYTSLPFLFKIYCVKLFLKFGIDNYKEIECYNFKLSNKMFKDVFLLVNFLRSFYRLYIKIKKLL